jgi:hypothetical protein
MATFTVTLGTEAAPIEVTSLGVRGNADTYNINGGYLRVDCDLRYGLNAAAAASMGNITLSATFGGTIEFSTAKVRLIPYNTGSGTVPAGDTVVSVGSASGKLICVYSALTAAPTAVGGAMPASGFIKIRAWNSVAFAAGAFTGISATATGPEEPGWLEIPGSDTYTVTVNRLNKFKVRGEYFYFRGVTTSGTRATTYQIPTHGNAVYIAGVEVETGTDTGVYEFYPTVFGLTATYPDVGTEEARGKVCWLDTANGLIRFGHDGTNSTGGYLPPSGRKIRIPNIFFVCCTTTGTNVVPNATADTRLEFLTTGGGVIDIETCCMNWYLNLLQPFSVNLQNVIISEALVLKECASAIAWNKVLVGITSTGIFLPFDFGTNLAGGTLTDCIFARTSAGSSGNAMVSAANCSGFTFTDVVFLCLVKAASSNAGSFVGVRVYDTVFIRPKLIGCVRFALSTCSDITVTDAICIDRLGSFTRPNTAGVMYLYDLLLSTVRCMFEGVSFPVANNQPAGGLLQIGATGCSDITMRNMGSPSNILEGGVAGLVYATYTQVTTTATATTSAAHNLGPGSSIYVRVCSNTSIIALGLKAVLTVPTSTTFTFACTTGSTTGNFSYEITTLGAILTIWTGVQASRIRVQHVYVRNNRLAISVGDNSSKDIRLEHVHGSDYALPGFWGALDCVCREVAQLFPTTAQTSVYGTHWLICPLPDLPISADAVSWTRNTTTITVTNNGHRLRVGDIIYVHTTSVPASILVGAKTITAAANENTFTFTGINSGAASGTLSYWVQRCMIGVHFNEPSAATTDQVVLTGKAAFTSAGTLAMPAANDSAEFIYPGVIQNISAFLNAVPYMAAGTIADYHITYSVDGGTTYHNLQRTIAATSGTSGTYVVGFASTTGVEVGDFVTGTGIGSGAKVQSLNSTTVTLDVLNTATVSGNIVFNYIGNETALNTAGFPFRIKFVSKAGSATALRNIAVRARLSESAWNQYPLDFYTLTITGLPVGTDVVVLTAGTTTILTQTDQIPGTTYEYIYSAAQTVDIGFIKPGYVVQYIRNLVLGAANSTIPVALVPDRNYS